LAKVVHSHRIDAKTCCCRYLVGTDSTHMINGLACWVGRGGIEAKPHAGQPYYFLTPKVVGFRLREN